jgi:hypothetical protein
MRRSHAFTVKEASKAQRAFVQSQWFEPGTDIFGRMAGNARTVTLAEHVSAPVHQSKQLCS